MTGSFIALIAIKATVILALGLGALRFLRQSRAAVRHLLLLAVCATVLALPIAALVLPVFTIPVPDYLRVANVPSVVSETQADVVFTPVREAVITRSATGSTESVSVSQLVLIVEGLGATFVLLPLIAGLCQTRRLRAAARHWSRGQKRLDRLVRDARIRRHVEVLVHDCLPGPVTCGVWRPVLLFPADAKHWDDNDFERAAIHELEHVRRHDWATDCLARVVCSLYWFHPLAWMTWRRLRLESERAADDAVVRAREGTAYAELLVNLAERLVAGRRTYVISMASRRDLPRRIQAVLDASLPRGRAGGRCIAMTVVLAACVVLGVAPLGALADVKMTADEQDARAASLVLTDQTSRPKFEVVSIKPCKEPPQIPGRVVTPGQNSSPGRLSTDCVPLLDANGIGLIPNAYATFADGHLNLDRASTPFEGGPSWLHSARYEINATAEGNPSVEMMMGPMMQVLLEDRFQLKIHRETTEGPVYILSLSRGGPKLHAFTEGSCTPYSAFPAPALQPDQGYCKMQISARSPAAVEAQGVTLDSFARMLRLVLDRPVIDKTGIVGRFDIRVEFSREGTKIGAIPLDGRPPADGTGPPSIFTALQEQLGLRLESGKGPVEKLVIDGIERPTEN